MAAVLPRGRATPGVILGYGGLVVLALEKDGLAIIAVNMLGTTKIKSGAKTYFALAIRKQS